MGTSQSYNFKPSSEVITDQYDVLDATIMEPVGKKIKFEEIPLSKSLILPAFLHNTCINNPRSVSAVNNIIKQSISSLINIIYKINIANQCKLITGFSEKWKTTKTIGQ